MTIAEYGILYVMEKRYTSKNGLVIFVAAAAIAGTAMSACADTLQRDVEFLLRYAPPQDLPLSGEYVTNNCVLAAVARETALERYPDEIYLDYVLPYSVIREGCDDWRGEFRERFAPLIADCTNSYDAAVTLDRRIWDIIGVHYNTKRDKARQSPRHSMRIGMASCTGISIILIDACRALGIPARLVGCNWTTIPGNHSWVEIWSGGRWRVLASGEKEREDNIWFLAYAVQADASRADRRIYASRWSQSPKGTLFWQTWEHPQRVSDVPADDVTSRYVPKTSLAVVVSPETNAIAEWRQVAEALVRKHEEAARTDIAVVCPTNCADALRKLKPRYVAFVMRPEEISTASTLAVKNLMRELDGDPFDDAIWGIVTGPKASDALRMASSAEPREATSILATTGVGFDVVPGPVAVISDALPKGEWREKLADGTIRHGWSETDLSPVFADAWARIDPEVLLTSSHASERNREMPFSRGTIVAKDGAFVAAPSVARLSESFPLARPEREKVWLAAGNCLIANHIDNEDMVMTAISFGKVNQFSGYIKTTWFGFVGWNAWRYFGSMGYGLAESHYAANQWLLKKLADGEAKDDMERAGLEWDRDATVFYGDPMHRVTLRPRMYPCELAKDGAPYLVVFPDSTGNHKLEDMPAESKAFIADDFALVFP